MRAHPLDKGELDINKARSTLPLSPTASVKVSPALRSGFALMRERVWVLK